MKEVQQSEALRLADICASKGLSAVEDELRRQRAHIAELEAELEAVGAGGVQALRKQAAAPQAVRGVGALYALQEAEAALELAIHRILKRDPGHAVHVTSEAKALVAVRAALDTAAPAHPAEGVPEDGFELWWADHMPKSTQTEAWSAWVALHKSTHPTQQGLGQANCKSGNWLTVVYRDIRPGDEARTIGEHPKVSALSWSHALNDRDAALAAQAKHGEQA